MYSESLLHLWWDSTCERYNFCFIITIVVSVTLSDFTRRTPPCLPTPSALAMSPRPTGLQSLRPRSTITQLSPPDLSQAEPDFWLGVCSILLRSKYLRRHTYTKLKKFWSRFFIFLFFFHFANLFHVA
jgi:hypothetical protein